MRNAIGKGNDSRKVLTYYRVNFDVHAPYRVLCDAPIIHVAPNRDIVLKEALPKLLGDNAIPVVTRCIIEELRALGEDFSKAAAIAKRMPREPCAHGGTSRKSSSDCISAIIQRGNTTGIIIASNDAQVLQSAQENGSFPVVTIANQTRLVLRKPSANSIQELQQSKERENAVLSKMDQALLKKSKEESKRFLKPRRTIRKRKRAKGPNPLSMKKSKKNKEKKPDNDVRDGEKKSSNSVREPAEKEKSHTGRRRRKRNKTNKQVDVVVVE